MNSAAERSVRQVGDTARGSPTAYHRNVTSLELDFLFDGHLDVRKVELYPGTRWRAGAILCPYLSLFKDFAYVAVHELAQHGNDPRICPRAHPPHERAQFRSPSCRARDRDTPAAWGGWSRPARRRGTMSRAARRRTRQRRAHAARLTKTVCAHRVQDPGDAIPAVARPALVCRLHKSLSSSTRRAKSLSSSTRRP